MPLEVQPYASPAWVRQQGRVLGPHTPPGDLIQHTTAPELWARWFDAAGVTPPALNTGPRHELMSMARNAALVGLGVALLPSYMTDDAVKRRRLVRLSPVRVRGDRSYWLVVRPAAAARPGVQAFRNWLLAQRR